MPRSVEAVVPLYFFNQRFNGEFGADAVGLDLPGLAAVRHRAIELAREIMSDALLGGEIVLDRCIEVTDTTGQIVLSLPFADVAKLRLPKASSGRRGASMPSSLHWSKRHPKNDRDAP